MSYGKVIREHPFGVNMGETYTILLTYTVEGNTDDIKEIESGDTTIDEWIDENVLQGGVDLGIGDGDLEHTPEYY